VSGDDFRSLYTDGIYLTKNPDWHLEDSAWKAGNMIRILDDNRMVNRVVPDAELEKYVKDDADMIADNAPLSIRAAKATIAEIMKEKSKRDFKRSAAMVEACFKSGDYEGRKAFMEKRKPVFTGS
jgi:1,4-dihydroxy-2-naphthoyl-CoA synthase